MTTAQLLTDTECVAALTQLKARFPHHEWGQHLNVIERWASRTAHLYRCGLDTGQEVVVKVLSDGTAEQAEAAYQWSQRFGSTFARMPMASARPVKIWGWLSDPPLLCMDHVDGSGLSSILRDALVIRTEDTIEHTTDLVRLCGQTLRWLRELPAPSSTTTATDPFRPHSALTTWLAGGNRAVRALRELPPTVITAGDYAPYNLVERADGEVLWIDLPHAMQLGTKHRDPAWFTFSLARMLQPRVARDSNNGNLHSSQLPSDVEDLVDHWRYEFLLTCFGTAGSVLPPFDQGMVAYYEARRGIGVIRKRLRQSRYREIPWLVRYVRRRRTECKTFLTKSFVS